MDKRTTAGAVVATFAGLAIPAAWASGDAPIHYHSKWEAFQFFAVQLAAFALLFWFLRKFAWPPLARSLDARREQYAKSFQEIARLQQEGRELRSTLEQRLAGIDQETKGRIAKALADGEVSAKEIRAETEALIARILARAKSEIEIEREKAVLELRLELAELSIAAARERLAGGLPADREARLLDGFLKDLDRQPVVRGAPE